MWIYLSVQILFQDRYVASKKEKVWLVLRRVNIFDIFQKKLDIPLPNKRCFKKIRYQEVLLVGAWASILWDETEKLDLEWLTTRPRNS